MECSCVRHTEVPGTSKLFTDLLYHFDRVADFYPAHPNSLERLIEASTFAFPAERRAALVRALGPLNEGNPSLAQLAKPGTVCVVTGQQVGLFSGPAYSVYKALTAIRAAAEMRDAGVSAVPVFWIATEDHDFAEVDHTWVFGPDERPVKIRIASQQNAAQELGDAPRPVGTVPLCDLPIEELRAALAGLPFADDAVALVERAYRPGETLGSAFAHFLKELFAPYGLLLIDPLIPAVREIAAPLLQRAVEAMPELCDALIARSKELVARGYHAQVLVDAQTSLVFLLDKGRRIALKRGRNGAAHFTAPGLKLSVGELAARGVELSPNALLRPVMQDYLLPTAAYVGGPAELAYLAQSQVLYRTLLERQPVAFPRAGFTVIDARAQKQLKHYGLRVPDLFVGEQTLRDAIAARLIPQPLEASLERTRAAFAQSLDALSADLKQFDVTLASALETSRRKIEYQTAKIAHKTAAEMMARDARAGRDAASLSGLIYPERHLQERLYSFVPFIAKFGPGLVNDLHDSIRIECPDHQIACA